MQLRLLITTRFCVWWTFFCIYASLIYIAAIEPVRHSDVIAPTPLGLALVLGWLPAAIGAACAGLFAWLVRRFLSPAWQMVILLPLVATLAAWPFAYHYYQAHFSYAARYHAAYNEAMRVAPGGLALYMQGGDWQIRREAFLDNYGYRYSGRPPLDTADIPVVERILSEEFSAFSDVSEAVAKRYGSPGIYTLFTDLVAARLGNQSLAELFARWPPRLLVDVLFAPEAIQKLDALTLSPADMTVLHDHSAAAVAEQDPYGTYGLIWLDLRQPQAGTLAKVFGYCEALLDNRDYCRRFAVERLASQWHRQIADAAVLYPDDAAALRKLLGAYFDAQYKFMPPETPMALLRWVLLDALRTRPLTAILAEWSAHRAEQLKILLSASVLNHLQTQSDWTSGNRQALRQALAELSETPLPESLRYDDFYGGWMGWMNTQLELLRPGRLEELFALCRRLPLEREQRLSCFRYIFDDFNRRQDFPGLRLADDSERDRDFAVLAQGVEELPQLTQHKGMHFDARLALYKLRKALLRPGETAELLALAQNLDESGGYGVTYRQQTLQWLMAEAHAEPPRYQPNGDDRVAIIAMAETIGADFKAQQELVRRDLEAAVALGDVPEKAYRDIETILAWVRGD